MFWKWLGLLAGYSALACGGSVPHPPYAAQATNALTVIDTPPPPGRIERIPARPAGADAWVDGEWIRRHGRWYWLVGRWVKTPPGARYAPWVVVRALDATAFYAPSIWIDGQGSVVPPPPALALAVANGEAVFDAEGQVEPTGRTLTTAPTPPTPREDQPDGGTR